MTIARGTSGSKSSAPVTAHLADALDDHGALV
jgi:hypothetical protein